MVSAMVSETPVTSSASTRGAMLRFLACFLGMSLSDSDYACGLGYVSNFYSINSQEQVLIRISAKTSVKNFHNAKALVNLIDPKLVSKLFCLPNLI